MDVEVLIGQVVLFHLNSDFGKCLIMCNVFATINFEGQRFFFLIRWDL
jgi:hypothetical protein